MSEALYHQAIKDIAASLNAYPPLNAPDRVFELDNMFCGDRVKISLHIRDGIITAAGCQAWGCLLTKAALAAMVRHLPGQSLDESRSWEEEVMRFLADGKDEVAALIPGLDIFAPVRPHKSRFDCVILPFQAIKQGEPGF